jgi:hypothetical protein
MPNPKLDACLFTVRRSDFYGYSRIPSIYLQTEYMHFVATRDRTHTHMYGRHNHKKYCYYYYYYYYYKYYYYYTNTRPLVRSSTWGLIVVRKFLAFMKPNFEFSLPLGYDAASLDNWFPTFRRHCFHSKCRQPIIQ